MRKLIVVYLIVIIELFLFSLATAAPVTFEISGTLNNVTNPDGIFDSSITESSPFSGFYTFESEALDENNYNALGVYNFSEQDFAMSVMIAGNTFESNSGGSIQLNNGYYIPHDRYTTFTSIDPQGYNSAYIIMEIEWLDYLISDDLLVEPPDLGEAFTNEFKVAYTTGTSTNVTNFVTGTLESITLVPEPATIVLLGIGSLILFKKHRK